MKILAVGGGSGGHVTPVVAVLTKIHELEPDSELRFWCDKSFEKRAKAILSKNAPSNVKIDVVTSGKLRRYHHLSVLKHITIPSIFFANIRDIFKVGYGFLQAFFKLITWRPDIVFTKGGYVCLPVGLAANLLRIPVVIHDSDAHPGLTNRLLAKHANFIATGAPLKYYSYPEDISRYIGIPISSDFTKLSQKERVAEKEGLRFKANEPLIVITGGGLGAKRINDVVVDNLDKITSLGSVLLISGDKQYESLRRVSPDNDKYKLVSFVDKNMNRIIGAADVVVARAGATTILELAAVAAPTILVPNARLTGGHQVKNAKVYEDADAAIVIDETKFDNEPDIFLDAVNSVLSDKNLKAKLSNNISLFAKPDAALDMANIIINFAKTKHN